MIRLPTCVDDLSAPANLENHQIVDAVAYVVSADPFPAGSSEVEAATATSPQVAEPERWVTGIVARNPYHQPE
ncbi:hypothetical protein ACWELB_13555 [Streptomyces asiaticus]